MKPAQDQFATFEALFGVLDFQQKYNMKPIIGNRNATIFHPTSRCSFGFEYPQLFVGFVF